MDPSKIQPTQKYDLVARSVILRGEKPTKGLDAQLSTNPNQMHRVTAYLSDGTRAIVAQRPGRGGMDFNKLLGGKVFAVAADAFSPIYEKGADGKATRNQKQEGGLPLYSASGFYTLSTKDYPALLMFEAFTKLFDKGEKMLLVTNEQLADTQRFTLKDEMDWDLANIAFGQALDDEKNLVAAFDVDANKRRKRGIENAKNVAEDEGEDYAGVEFSDMRVCQKDGNPFVLYQFTVEGEQPRFGELLREREGLDDNDRPAVFYDDVDATLARFGESADGKAITAALASGKSVAMSFVQGHVMRTSVSFRRKVENVTAAGDKIPYGDAVYIVGALAGWTRAMVTLMHSMHPNFPEKDYESHYFVAAPRQLEVGMNRKTEGTGFTPPKALMYDLTALLA